MSQPLDKPVFIADRAEFHAWAERHPGRWERHDGWLVLKAGEPGPGGTLARAPERLVHSQVKGNATMALTAAIRRAGAPCQAYVDGPMVETGTGTDFIPDVVVNCGPADRNRLSVPNPVIVVEVLSPSSAGRDLSVKMVGYFGIASVQHYVIVDPDRASVVQHSRRSDGTLLTLLHRPGGTIMLDPPGLSFPVEELYDGVDLSVL